MLSVAKTLFLLGYCLPLITGRGLFEPRDTSPSTSTSSLDRRLVFAANADICETLALTVPFTTVKTCVSNTAVSVAGLGTVVQASAAVCTSVVSVNVASGTGGCTTVQVSTKVTAALTVDVPTTTCITITENDIAVSTGICLCTQNRLLTQASLDSISAAVNASTAVTTALTNANANAGVSLTTAAVTNYLNSIELNILLKDGDANVCGYPQGAIPNCSAKCAYTCPSGYNLCGGKCSTSCISGVPSRRRSLRGDADFRCPKGYAACATSAKHLANMTPFSAFDCIDTESDIESCGGCAFPLNTNDARGQDCTALPNTAGVRCRSGQCIVESCLRGFVVSSSKEACVKK